MNRFVDPFERRGVREAAWHDVAQICLNGHVINSSAKASPEFSKKFCDRCGALTVTQCGHCNGDIRGTYHMPGVVASFHFHAPAFCAGCGAAYPWTETTLQAARDLTNELGGLNEAEKEALSKSLDDLVRDSPQTQVAATRLKRLLPKIGREGAATLRDLLVDIASETAKRMIWPS